MALYIHYGSPKFSPHMFQEITNRDSFNKPYGGLWASRVGAERSWRNWCESENFRLQCLDTHFRFAITPAAKVCHLYSSKDLDLLPQREDYIDTGRFYPDFEQMVKDGWDAVELHLSSEDEDLGYDSLYWWLYGWDCDSILILNPKIIMPVTYVR